MPETKRISGPETSKIIKQTLKKTFPGIDFSVRYKSYSMGCSISIHWTDGPTTKQVNAITNKFERCGFDGMQDMKTYLPPVMHNGELTTFGADYIHSSRSESFEALKRAAFEVAFQCELPLLEIETADYSRSFYSSPQVKGGNNIVDWHLRTGFDDPSQNGFSYDPYHICLPTSTHAELIYQYARTIDFIAKPLKSEPTYDELKAKIAALEGVDPWTIATDDFRKAC